MAAVAFVSAEGGDWIGVYADGMLVEEGHSLDPRSVMRHFINAQIEDVNSMTMRDSSFEKFGGRCPTYIEEINPSEDLT